MSAEVQAGYKQSEVGVIPVDWAVSAVGCEFEIKLGKMIDAEKNVGVLKPYIGNKAVQWDRIDISDLPMVPMSRSDIERFRLRNGDLLVCEGGEVGRCAIWHSPIDECYYQKALHRLRPVRGFDSRLMAALLRQWSERGQLINYATQTSIAHLPREKFLEIPMAVPPPEEQRAIVTALSDMDALLAKLDALITKKHDLKTAAMQQLLTGQTRLPGFSEKWEAERLGDVFTISAGKSKSAYVETGGRYWVVDMGSVSTGGKLIVSKATNFHGDFLCAGDLVMPKDDIGGGGIIGRVGYIDADNTYILGDHVYRLTAVRGNSLFLSYVINGNKTNSALRKKVIGSAQLGLGRKSVEDQDIPFPSNEEQSAIATVLADMDTELAVLEARRDKTWALKRGMLQELLTGRIRLVNTHTTTPAQPEQKSAEVEQPHSWAFNEAVVIAVLADQFGKPEFPLGRMRYTKLAYLLHRKAENDAQGYLKKKAGPYNPQTRYAGPEKIAQQNGYVRSHSNGKFKGWVSADKIEQAKNYFYRWYGPELASWLEQFRYTSNDGLERLATVDMAMKELAQQDKPVDLNAVRTLIESEPEWAPKLTREVFSDDGIAAAMAECRKLFSG